METARLRLRQFTPEDFREFRELILDKMSSPYAKYDQPFPTDEKGLHDVLQYFMQSDEFFAVELKSEAKVIGFVTLNREDYETRNLGYCIHTAYQGNQYASEAVEALITYAKHALGLRRLVSGTAEDNTPSVRLLESAGFTMTVKSEESFSADENGNPLTFTGCAFERIL